MKYKHVLGILTTICVGSCAFALASCGLFGSNHRDEQPYEPPEEEQECLYIELSSAGHYHGIVSGLGSITSTDIEIPAEIKTADYGILPIEEIADDAFKNTAITSVKISEKITTIGSKAFSGCNALTSVTMLGEVTYIADKAFSNCTSLSTVTMTDGAERVELGEYVFENCTSLSSVTLPNCVTSFENGLFKNCTSLKSLTLPNSLDYIHYLAFDGTAITSFDTDGCEKFSWENDLLINKNTTAGFIAEYANPEAAEIIVPDGVQDFYCNFRGNGNIKKVDLNGVKNLGLYTFNYSSLEELLNYDNVTNASLSTFQGTPWLENKFKATENIIVGKVFLLYREKETVFSVPEGVETIGERAFAGTAVQSVILPNSVDSIGNQAFAECESLESVILKGRPPYLASGDVFPGHTVIYVSAGWLAYYKSDIIWKHSVTNEILLIPDDWDV